MIINHLSTEYQNILRKYNTTVALNGEYDTVFYKSNIKTCEEEE